MSGRSDSPKDRLRKAIGKRIAGARNPRSQAWLAEELKRLGVGGYWTDSSVISDLEKGRRAIDLEDIEVLAAALGTSRLDLLLPVIEGDPALPDLVTAKRAAEIMARDLLVAEQLRIARRLAELELDLQDPLISQTAVRFIRLSIEDRAAVARHVEGLLALTSVTARTPNVTPNTTAQQWTAVKLPRDRRRHILLLGGSGPLVTECGLAADDSVSEQTGPVCDRCADKQPKLASIARLAKAGSIQWNRVTGPHKSSTVKGKKR